VINRLKSMGANAKELEGLSEDVSFSLPKSLR